MWRNISILGHQGKQYIEDVKTANVPGIFRGRPEIIKDAAPGIAGVCPVNAIMEAPLRIDLGRCAFCAECAIQYPEHIRFTTDYKLATNARERLIVAQETSAITLDHAQVRKEIEGYFGRSLKLRQVSAGGDNSSELELIACSNVNFDMGRFGIEFVASPRHADGIVITGPITKNMAYALQDCYNAIPEPRLIVLAGTDAISGGIYEGSPELDRSFLKTHPVDLYVPGNPVHPLTFINGILALIERH